MIEPGFGELISQIAASPAENSNRFHIFSVYPYSDEKTNAAANEVLRKLRELETRVADIRIANLPDYVMASANPHWPIAWIVDGLDNSDKQIVLEVNPS